MNDLSIHQLAYIKQKTKYRHSVNFFRCILFIAFLLIWQITASFGIIDSFIFSSPAKIAACFYEMLKDGTILPHIFITLTETFFSFLLVIFIGILTSVLLWTKEKLAEILEPYLVVLNSLPKSALAPLLIVWLGANMNTIIIAGISVAIFGTIISLYTGFKEVDEDKIKLIYTLGGSRQNVLLKVVLPSSIPVIISTMKVNIGLALVGVIIGEFLAARKGLGYLIIYSSQVFKMDWLLMSIVLLCIMAMLLYMLLGMAEKIIMKRF
ncbi:ABC transporter permease [Konateibacter massiliensis]|uniref:ABC transporter permease n=1 Tax=Konateibacter massiliensis TaxID=2002841 RepID=UPI000C15BAB3|nr:ABC transporter permease [Konateibacter massiliensis]